MKYSYIKIVIFINYPKIFLENDSDTLIYHSKYKTEAYLFPIKELFTSYIKYICKQKIHIFFSLKLKIELRAFQDLV